MTRIRVGPEALTALASALSGVADELAWFPGRAASDTWAFGPGETPGALSQALGDFEHQRLLVGRSCEALAAAVRTAGSAYAEVDAAVTLAAGGGPGAGLGAVTGSGVGAGAEVAAGASGGGW